MEDTQSYSNAVIQKALELDIQKILCDETKLKYTLSLSETYQLAEYVSKEIISIKRIAVLCNKDFLEEGQFFETVSSNRGVMIRVSTDIQSAREWLMNS